MNPIYLFGAVSKAGTSEAWDSVVSFDSLIQPGDWNVLQGNPLITWQQSEGAVQIAFNGSNQLTFVANGASPTQSRNCVIEADLELVSDPFGRNHFGLFLSTGASVNTGYRVCGFDNEWLMSRFVNGVESNQQSFGNYPEMSQVPSGLIKLRLDVTPTQVTLRINDTIVGTVNDALYTTLVPGIFVYNCNVKCFEIRTKTTA